ncbi:MAG: imidazole glycerol phosphate synthase subunit HisH [Acidobacteriota bacterium]
MSASIVVVDYGMGNVASVLNAFARLGTPARLSALPEEIAAARQLVLPGVGAFGDAAAEIDRRGLRQAILEAVRNGATLLGICLGMQLLFERSEENPDSRGLALLEGHVRRLPAHVRVPHIGWNCLEQVSAVPLLAGLRPGDYLYFVHSFYAEPAGGQAAACVKYGIRFAAVAGDGRIWGVQPHPEKSQRVGETLLRNFVALQPEVRSGDQPHG